MAQRPEELAELADTIERENLKLTALRVRKERELASLKDAVSSYPETRDFLKARGLTHIGQLDAQGIRELRAHLERVLRATLN